MEWLFTCIELGRGSRRLAKATDDVSLIDDLGKIIEDAKRDGRVVVVVTISFKANFLLATG